jgi:hypothetical protein
MITQQGKQESDKHPLHEGRYRIVEPTFCHPDEILFKVLKAGQMWMVSPIAKRSVAAVKLQF